MYVEEFTDLKRTKSYKMKAIIIIVGLFFVMKIDSYSQESPLAPIKIDSFLIMDFPVDYRHVSEQDLISTYLGEHEGGVVILFSIINQSTTKQSRKERVHRYEEYLRGVIDGYTNADLIYKKLYKFKKMTCMRAFIKTELEGRNFIVDHFHVLTPLRGYNLSFFTPMEKFNADKLPLERILRSMQFYNPNTQ